MKKGDEAALFAFDTQLQKVSGFTTDFKGLEAKVAESISRSDRRRSMTRSPRRPRPWPTPLAATGKVPQRSAIVVLTDGIDTKSRLTAPEVSAIASSIDVPVYVVAVMSPVDDPRNPDYGDGGAEQRVDRSGAMDRRRLFYRDLAGAREHRGPADRR